MEFKEFAEKLADILNVEREVLEGVDRLSDLPAWDSFGALSTIAFLDSEYGLSITYDALAASSSAELFEMTLTR